VIHFAPLTFHFVPDFVVGCSNGLVPFRNAPEPAKSDGEHEQYDENDLITNSNDRSRMPMSILGATPDFSQ